VWKAPRRRGGSARGAYSVTSEWEGLTVTLEEFFGVEDGIVVLGETSDKHRATGRSFKSPFPHAWRLRDCRVVESCEYIDTDLVREAAGTGS
jgi:ketosteroid isomerase-like protein